MKVRIKKDKKTSIVQGSFYFIIAQLFFLASGYILHAGLGRLLGPAIYGIFGIILYLSTISQDLLRYGLPQAASKYIAEDNSKFYIIKKKTLKLQLVYSLIIFFIYFFLSEKIANFLGDISLANYIKFSAILIPSCAIFSIYINYLNGLRWYKKQAIVQFIYSILKILFIFSLLLLLLSTGFEIYGILLGYTLTFIGSSIVAWFFIRKGKGIWEVKLKEEERKEENITKRLITFSIPIIIFYLTLTFILSIDLFFVKSILHENELAGFYTAASTIAKVPFFVLGSLTFALFPAISESTSNKDLKRTRKYIKESLRYLSILLVPTIFLTSSNSKEILNIFYSEKYLPAGGALSILSIGLGFFTFFLILTSIINASGKPKVSMFFNFILIPISLSLNFLLIPYLQLKGAAIATTFTAFLAFLFSLIYVAKNFKISLLKIFISLGKVFLISIFIFFISEEISFVPLILVPVKLIVLFFLSLFLLFLAREIKREEDFERFRSIFHS